MPAQQSVFAVATKTSDKNRMKIPDLMICLTSQSYQREQSCYLLGTRESYAQVLVQQVHHTVALTLPPLQHERENLPLPDLKGASRAKMVEAV